MVDQICWLSARFPRDASRSDDTQVGALCEPLSMDFPGIFPFETMRRNVAHVGGMSNLVLFDQYRENTGRAHQG
jgi:hypothetical protein